MTLHLEITDGEGFREQTVDAETFWIGCDEGSEVTVAVPGCHSRVLEVRLEEGRIQIRTEPGLPFPVRCVTGNVGSRFEPLLDGDVLNVGPALVKIRGVSSAGLEGTVELDLDAVTTPGAPIGAWYATFMEVADHLEGVSDPARAVDASLGAVLDATSADRVYLRLEKSHAIDERTAFYQTRDGANAAFRVSSSVIDRVLETGRAVHVPVASRDPVASQFASVRREGISSSIALPLSALGRHFGVLYADCVRDGAMLDAENLHRVAFIGRMLASALGNRSLVATLVRESGKAAAEHPALETSAPACKEMIERTRLYAPTDYTVLIRGETGAGKEVMARALHDLSRRADGPFVPVNCAAIPEQLMESMLFGHEKGAFTGATQTRRGHFEEAHGGTLFLDEIGDMALDLQAKILRVVQERVVMPVGGSKQIKVDVRILAATHQDLERMVAEKQFREDLYYRLRELEVLLPPLRQRREDILMLATKFLAEAAVELGREEPPELATDTLDHLQQLPWRGNIRELRHVLKAAALRAVNGIVRIEHLDAGPPPVAAEEAVVSTEPAASDATWKERLEAQEKAALEETLNRAGGNLTRAARLFGVPRTTYREKLVKNGLLKD